jgi:hypothetical protein
MTIHSLSHEIDYPVRIMGIVIESQPGIVLVQDIYDEIDKAASIKVIVSGTLEVAKKYILFGTVMEKKMPKGKELMLNAQFAYDISSLDIQLFKDAIRLQP